MLNTSLFLAKTLGVLLLVGGIYMLTKKENATELFRRFGDDRTAFRTGGFLEIAAGLFLVFGHPVFSGWPVIITLVGIAALAEGIFYLFASKRAVRHIYESILNSGAYTFLALILLAFGGFLTYAGFVF